VFETVSAEESPAEFVVTPEGWTRLCDAFIAADFWSLDPAERGLGFDGAQCLIRGAPRKCIPRCLAMEPEGWALRARPAVLRAGWTVLNQG
jgi:hypothetical protein